MAKTPTSSAHVVSKSPDLPDDPDELRSPAASLIAEIRSQAVLIEKLRHQFAGHRIARFGSSTETIDQLNLALEASEVAVAAMTARLRLPHVEPTDGTGDGKSKPARPSSDPRSRAMHADRANDRR